MIRSKTVLVALAFCQSAHAQTPTEFWPELSGFLNAGSQTRLYVDAAYAKGKESPTTVGELSGYLDVSLRPIRRKLRTEDWQRSRFLWARIGYDHVFSNTDGMRTSTEDRGIVSLYGKFAFPLDIWLEARARTDLRWIGDAYSTRYRGRLDFTREFVMFDHAIVPYANVEWFYDDRYSGLARTLYTVGGEVACTDHLRFEVYVARQNDHIPVGSTLNAAGLVSKFYY